MIPRRIEIRDYQHCGWLATGCQHEAARACSCPVGGGRTPEEALRDLLTRCAPLPATQELRQWP